MSDALALGGDSEWDFFHKKQIRKWISELFFLTREIDSTKTKLLLVDTPELDGTRFFVEEMGIEPKNIIVVNWNKDKDLPPTPAALIGFLHYTGRDVYTLAMDDVRDVAVAFVDVCAAGITRYNTEFTKPIDPFALVPIVVETHSIYGSKYQEHFNWRDMQDDYKERHEEGQRMGVGTQVFVYPGKHGNKSKMVLASSRLDGFQTLPIYFGVMESAAPPASSGTKRPRSPSSDDGRPSQRTRLALQGNTSPPPAPEVGDKVDKLAVLRRPPGRAPKGQKWDDRVGWVPEVV